MADSPTPSILEVIKHKFDGLLDAFPVEASLDSFSTLPPLASYGEKPQILRQYHQAMVENYGVDSEFWYNKLILLARIDRYFEEQESERYPDDIKALFLKHFADVRRKSQIYDTTYYSFSNDLFLKDLGIARGKLVPCGAQLVDIRSGMGRRGLLVGGPRKAIALLSFVFGRMGGFKPLYQLHMDLRLLLDFNPAGWERCFRRVAQLLASDPEIRGVFGGSWWFDPQLDGVSPRLGFLRELPMRNGAGLFCAGMDDAAREMALARSKERQQAFEQGRYQPRTFVLIWPRSALLDWARRP